MQNLLLFLLLNISPATQSDQLFVASDSLFNETGIITLGNLDGWRFHPGDDLNWANPDFDDSDWIFYKPTGLTEPIPDSLWNGYGWFRYRFAADSSVYAMATHLYFSSFGAAEVYLDGKLVRKYGTFSIELQGEKRYMPNFKTHPAVVLRHGESHVLAVRFSYHKGERYMKLLGKHAGTFGFGIGLGTDYYNQYGISLLSSLNNFIYILGTMLFLITLLHVFLFILFPVDRSNLYIAIVAFLLFLNIITAPEISGILFELDVMQELLISGVIYIILLLTVMAMIPFTVNSMFNQDKRMMHKLLICLIPVFALGNFILSGPSLNIIILIIFTSTALILTAQVLIQAWRNKQKGVWFVASAFFGLILSGVAFRVYSSLFENYWNIFGKLLVYMACSSIPLGLTAFMASRFRDLYTHLEEKVVERTHALNQSLEELRSTQSQLIQSEKMASLGQLTAGIAHEIQNPLNFVNNFSDVNKELLEELKEELAEGGRQLAAGSRQSLEDKLKSAEEIANDVIGNEQKINHHGKRAEAIVKGMLLHSRGNSGHKELVDINSLCDEYLRLSYHGFRAKDKSFNADYKTDFDPNLPKINVVPQDIGRVLLNLINNAFYAVDKKAKHMTPPPPEGGIKERGTDYKPMVIVRTSSWNPPTGGRGASISVIDNGPGIPQNIIDKIFQPFFTTKPTGQGTGLGLSLAYDMVKAHGGEIKVETKEGEGSEFMIQLIVT
jgi:two-component system, NtrC family, sensor kinase